MRRLPTFAAAILLAASLSTAVRCDDVVATFDAAGTQADGFVYAYVPTNIYVIGKEIGEVSHWELGFQLEPASLTITERIVNNGPGDNLGDEDNYIVSLGGCFGAPGWDYLFVTYQIIDFTGTPFRDGSFCIVPPNEALPPASGTLAYTNCQNEAVSLFTRSYHCGVETDLSHCAILNSTYICGDSETSSWSAVKAGWSRAVTGFSP